MTKSDATLDMTAEDLMAGLQAIATPAEIEVVNRFLELGLDSQGSDDAQGKARKRTARYKLRTALRREPSSQHILQACAYVVFARNEKDTRPFVAETLDLLVSAGFDRKHAGKAMKRFVAGASTRKTSWVARTRSRLWLAISKAIKTLATHEDVTK